MRDMSGQLTLIVMFTITIELWKMNCIITFVTFVLLTAAAKRLRSAPMCLSQAGQSAAGELKDGSCVLDKLVVLFGKWSCTVVNIKQSSALCRG